MSTFDVRLVSPSLFLFDPRYEQMRTKKVLPMGRVFRPDRSDRSRFLSLPNEILWRITEFVAEAERGRFLSQFALVHSECRQLARPHQFVDMFITRSDKSWGLLRHLLREVKQDEPQPAGWSLNPPIGSCIRSLSFTVECPLCIDYTCSSYDDFEEWLKYWQPLIDDLCQAIECAMPNLERVFWMDTSELEVLQGLLKAVLQHSLSNTGRLHELAFTDFKFAQFSEIDELSACLPSHSIRLRSVALGDDYNYWGQYDTNGCVSYFAETILRRSAPTLESCVWNAIFHSMLIEEESGSDDARIWFRDGPINFPNLRKFWAYVLCRMNMDPGALECFLAAPLESFAPSATLCSTMIKNDLVEKFPLPHLRTFAITATEFDSTDVGEEYVEQVLSLAAHYAPKIEELYIYLLGGIDQLVSHFSNDNFCNLRSLCFSWGDDPELRVLKAIGLSLVTLEELSFGYQPSVDMTGRAYNIVRKFPLHDDIIAAISPLENLARLTVFGDEYIADWCGSDWAWHRFFKEHVWYNQGRSYHYAEGHESNYADGIWGHNRPGYKEQDPTRFMVGWPGHQHPPSAVVEIAQKYAASLPSLRGFVCGRVAVEITRRRQS